jgi:hypothetical protein
MGRSVVLIHLHVVRRLCMCRLGSTLLAGSLSLLLLLHAWRDSLVK